MPTIVVRSGDFIFVLRSNSEATDTDNLLRNSIFQPPSRRPYPFIRAVISKKGKTVSCTGSDIRLSNRALWSMQNPLRFRVRIAYDMAYARCLRWTRPSSSAACARSRHSHYRSLHHVEILAWAEGRTLAQGFSVFPDWMFPQPELYMTGLFGRRRMPLFGRFHTRPCGKSSCVAAGRMRPERRSCVGRDNTSPLFFISCALPIN
jgi:hypothetical protein